MVEIVELERPSAEDGARAVEALERGGVVILPRFPFVLEADEHRWLDPAILKPRSKNVSLDPATGELRGAEVDEGGRQALARLLRRFGERADALLDVLAPRYGPALQRRRTSLRPGAIAERALSPRKDDRRLHLDAFPSSPVQGRRILRVFANVNPHGLARVWNVGEDGIEAVAARFPAALHGRARLAGARARLGLTRGRASDYDAVMGRLHDFAKLDETYQRDAPRRRIGFAAGSIWICYTDALSHAALSGQHALEQTYLMTPDAMYAPERSPLAILRRLAGRALV